MTSSPPFLGPGSRVTVPERELRLGHRGAVVWLTGLSGAGKSTLAVALERHLFGQGVNAVRLDGDEVRKGLCKDLGFSPEARAENVRRVGQAAELLRSAGLVVVVALISPYREDRRRARAIVPDGRFFEVFVDAPLAVCVARDPKGLYAAVRDGRVKEFTGISAPYEPPEKPELVLDTANLAIDACVERLSALLTSRGIFDVR